MSFHRRLGASRICTESESQRDGLISRLFRPGGRSKGARPLPSAPFSCCSRTRPLSGCAAPSTASPRPRLRFVVTGSLVDRLAAPDCIFVFISYLPYFWKIIYQRCSNPSNSRLTLSINFNFFVSRLLIFRFELLEWFQPGAWGQRASPAPASRGPRCSATSSPGAWTIGVAAIPPIARIGVAFFAFHNANIDI